MLELSFAGTSAGLRKYIGELICEFCWGNGEVYFMEMDNDGNWANTGVRTCDCQLKEE